MLKDSILRYVVYACYKLRGRWVERKEQFLSLCRATSVTHVLRQLNIQRISTSVPSCPVSAAIRSLENMLRRYSGLASNLRGKMIAYVWIYSRCSLLQWWSGRGGSPSNYSDEKCIARPTPRQRVEDLRFRCTTLFGHCEHSFLTPPPLSLFAPFPHSPPPNSFHSSPLPPSLPHS